MKKITLILLASLISVNVNANGYKRAPEPKVASQVEAYSDEARLDLHEKEMKHLLERIEILEYNLNNLKAQLANSPQVPLAKVEKLPETKPESKPEIEAEPDVFNVAGIGEEPKSNIKQDKNAYDLALAKLKDKKFEDAEEQFAAFIRNYPKSSLQSNAYFWYGETFFRRGMFDKAAVNFLKGYKAYPKGAKASDSLLKLAQSLGNLEKKEEACNMLALLEQEFPSRAAASVKEAKDAKIKFGCNK